MLSNKSKAIGYIMLSAFGFALMTAFVRLAGDLPFTQKSLFRNLVAVAVAVIVLRREKCGFKWEKGNLPLLILRSTCGTLGIFCNYYAIDHLVLADANILNKMSPFFAILFSLFLPFVIADFHPMTFAQFMCLMGAGAAATLGQFGVTLAYLHAPAKEISVFDYTQVLFSAALGFFMFGQIPDGLSVLGYIVICGVSVAMFCYNRHLDAGEKA